MNLTLPDLYRKIFLRVVFGLGIFLCATSIGYSQADISFPNEGFKKSNPLLVCTEGLLKLVAKSHPDTLIGTWSVDLSTAQFVFSGSTNINSDSIYIKFEKEGLYSIAWTLEDTNSAKTFSKKLYVNYQAPSTPQIDSYKLICQDFFKLSAAKPKIGSGVWSANQPSTVQFSSIFDTSSTVFNLPKGIQKLYWTVSTSSSCKALKDSIEIDNQSPIIKDAGSDLNVCINSVQLNAVPVQSDEIGTWFFSLGIEIDDVHSPQAKVQILQEGIYKLYWQVSKDNCTAKDSILVTYSKPQKANIITTDKTICSDSVWLKAEALGGKWSQILGTSNLFNGTLQNVNITNLSSGLNRFVLSVENQNCSSSTDVVDIINNSVTRPIVRHDTCLFYQSGLSLALRAFSSKAGNWFPQSPNLVIEDSIRANYLNPVSAGHYSFYYKVTNGICKDSAKTQFSLLTKAVLPNDICLYVNAGETASVSFKAKNMPNNANGEKGSWTRLGPSTLAGQFIQKLPNDSVEFKNLSVGKYIYEWSIQDTACLNCTCNKRNADTITIIVTEKAKIAAVSGLCINSDTVSVGANLPSTSIGSWSAKDPLVGLSAIGKKAIVSKLKIGSNVVYFSLADNGCFSRDSISISRLTKPAFISDRCYLTTVDLQDTITATPPAVNETANWRLSQNLAFSFVANFPNKIVIRKNSPSDTVIRYSISSGNCQIINSSEFKVSFMKKPKAPSDTFVTLPISTPKILTGSDIDPNETVKWFGPNGKLLSATISLTLPDTVAGKYNFRVQKTGKNGCSKEDTVSVTYISNTKILTNPCSKQIKNLNIVADSINITADTGVWEINPPKLLYSYSKFPNQITIAGVDEVGEVTATWTVTSKKNRDISVRDSKRFVTITKPVLSGTLTICVKDSFYVLNEAKNLNLKPFEVGCWAKADAQQLGIIKNKNAIVDTIRQLKASSQIVYFIIKDSKSACADTAKAVLNVITKAVAGTQICTTDTNVRLNANIPNLASESGKWQYRMSTFNKVPTISNPTLSSTDVKGLGDRRTRFAWTIKSKNDSTKCFTTDSVRVVVNTRAKVDLKDECLKGTNLATLKANSLSLIKGYEKVAWVSATNTSDTISRRTTDTSKVKNGTSKLYYTVYDSTFRSCRTRDSLSVFVINKAVINKTVSCLIKQTEKDSVFISTLKAKDNTHMVYSWVKPFSNVTDTVFKSKASSTDSIHTFLLPSLGNRKFFWKVVSDQNSKCFDLDTISLTTVSKAKAFVSSPICTVANSINIVSSSDSNAVEMGQWSYLNSYSNNAPVIVNATSYKKAQLQSIGERETKLLWKIMNRQVPSCFSVDSANTTIVKNTAAKVGYSDTCIKAAKTVWLRGITPKSYENAVWTLLKDTVSKKNVDTVLAKIGSNKYVLTIADQIYKQCSSKDSLRVNNVNKNTSVSSPFCLVLPFSNSKVEQKVAITKDLDSTGLKYEWVSRSVFASDVVSKLISSAQYDSTKFVFSESGNRIYTRKISLLAAPSCQDTLNYLFTVIPKATAIVDSCLIGKMDTVSLKSNNTLLSAKGEKGLWKSNSNVKFLLLDTLAISKVFGIQKGKTEFVWTVSNGICKDSVKRKVVYINKASILNSDTCKYFDPTLNIQLKHDTILAALESGKWQPLGNVKIDVQDIASNFNKGVNKLQWKVYSNFDSTCSSNSQISFNLLSPSGFGSDTVFTCFRDDTVMALGNLLKNEIVSWRISSIKNDTSVLVYSDSISARLKKMSNQYPYSLYRQIKNNSCLLTDRLIVKNQQLDMVFIRPKLTLSKVDGKINSYYTCQTGVDFLMNDPDQEIKGALGYASVLERQNSTYKVSFYEKLTGNVVYNSGNLDKSGLYSVVWAVSNKNCKTMTDTIQLVKREGFGEADFDKNFKTSICDSQSFSFANTGLNLIVNPDKDAFRNLDSTSSATLELPPSTDSNRKNMVARRLLYGSNQFIYSVSKGACIANTFIDIIRSRPLYEVCSNINCDTSATKLVLCKQDSTMLTGTYTLINPSFDLGRFRIYWSNSKSDTVSVSDTTNIKHLNIDKKNSKVRAEVYNKTLDREKKIYLISKNGVCPAKIDSVTIINYRSVKGQAKIITNQTKVCNDSLLLNARQPTIGSGTWSVINSNAVFSDSDSNSTNSLLTKLTLGSQNVLWKVVNGICEDSAILKLNVGRPVGKATVLTSSKLELCDADSLELNAIVPDSNVIGSWYLLKMNSLVQQAKGVSFKVPLPKANTSIFKWVLSSDICSDTATVTVRNDKKPSVSVVGQNQSVKLSSATITGNEPQTGIGEWILVKGSGQIVNPKSNQTEIQNLLVGETVVQWQISNGVCPASTSQLVINYSDFEIPQAFSPNGDGKNDRFVINGLENFHSSKLIVFDRWGKEVFRSSDYKNEWDGSGLDDDTYFYVLDINGLGVKNGYIILKRK